MKKQILNIGKPLAKNEQKEVIGGFGEVPSICVEYVRCNTNDDCCWWQTCVPFVLPYPVCQ